MVVELLPEVGEVYGIFLQRARLPPSEEYHEGPRILGAGIAFSKDLAEAKAISELIERYTLGARFSFTRTRKDVPIHIQWGTRAFILSESGVGVAMPAVRPVLASACHLTREDGLQTAMAEAIERTHLMRWCNTCHNTSEVFLAELDLHAGCVPGPLRRYLSSKGMRFVFSWCRTSSALPALVCLALNLARDTFYATSSASPSPSEAIEKALLDCAKMFLMEELSLECGHPARYDHPVDLLPVSFRDKMVSELPPLTIGALELDGDRPYGVEYCGFLHIAPWTNSYRSPRYFHFRSVPRGNPEPVQVFSMTGLVKVNLACGETPFDDGWLNIDLRPQFKHPELSGFAIADLRNGIPIRSNSVDIIVTSHFLEHLDPFDECRSFLDDCFRILKPNGTLRIVVPDFRRIASIYLDDPRSFYQEYSYDKPWFNKARTWSRRLGISVMFGHKMLYDRFSLEEVLENSGFAGITHVNGPDQSLRFAEVIAEVIATHTFHSVVMDARKPN